MPRLAVDDPNFPSSLAELEPAASNGGAGLPSAAAAAAAPAGRLGLLIGAAAAMQEVFALLSRVAPTDATVFVIGESGTGKDLAAQTLHMLSARSRAVFLPFNCGAVSPSLIESELFGHERCNFTGA